MVSSVYKHGTASEWFKQPDMGDHYETLGRASPKLALDDFEKTMQAQKKGCLLHPSAQQSRGKRVICVSHFRVTCVYFFSLVCPFW